MFINAHVPKGQIKFLYDLFWATSEGFIILAFSQKNLALITLLIVYTQNLVINTFKHLELCMSDTLACCFAEDRQFEAIKDTFFKSWHFRHAK